MARYLSREKQQYLVPTLPALIVGITLLELDEVRYENELLRYLKFA